MSRWPWCMSGCPSRNVWGRVCAHPCESKCRRGDVNDPVSIRNIKRYAAEHADNELWKKNSKYLPATGKRVCVVGGGPGRYDSRLLSGENRVMKPF